MVYTFGHSILSLNLFFEVLSSFDIKYIYDIRSSPYSMYTPQFNAPELSKRCEKEGFNYSWLGKELGGKRTEDCVYIDNKVSFDKVAELEIFKKGIQTIKDNSQENIVLLCSESDPLKCHRFSLIGRQLLPQGVNLIHILGPSLTKSQKDLENEIYEKPKSKGFGFSKDDGLSKAYNSLEKKIAYQRNIQP